MQFQLFYGDCIIFVNQILIRYIMNNLVVGCLYIDYIQLFGQQFVIWIFILEMLFCIFVMLRFVLILFICLQSLLQKVEIVKVVWNSLYVVCVILIINQVNLVSQQSLVLNFCLLELIGLCVCMLDGWWYIGIWRCGWQEEVVVFYIFCLILQKF